MHTNSGNDSGGKAEIAGYHLEKKCGIRRASVVLKEHKWPIDVTVSVRNVLT